MAARGGWDPEPTFGDALVGSSGMSDPVDQPMLFDSPAADVFPDALSAQPMAGQPVVAGLRPAADSGEAELTASRIAPVPLSPGQVDRPQPRVPDPRSRVTAAAPRVVSPSLRPATPAMTRPGQVGAWPAPVVAPAFRSGGYPAPVFRSPGYPAPPPKAPVASTAVAVSAPGYQPTAPAPPRFTSSAQRARATQVKKGSNAWGCLVFLAIALFATGLGQKIIAVISEFLQRK
jgi:hypothetical protein